jgi:hypothetical protein
LALFFSPIVGYFRNMRRLGSALIIAALLLSGSAVAAAANGGTARSVAADVQYNPKPPARIPVAREALPVTGYDPLPAVLLGVGLLASGAVLRRRARQSS